MIKNVSRQGEWKDVYWLALKTVGKQGYKEPSDAWKLRMLKAEHSPIRALTWVWTWEIPYWVSVHMVRHKVGIEHFVRTQRSDRTGVERSELPQGALVEHTCVATTQALINISRKRLCRSASRETREAWEAVKQAIGAIDPLVASVLVPECVYRGHCSEMNSCRFFETDTAKLWLEEYRNAGN